MIPRERAALIKPPIPKDEEARLASLRSLAVLDTAPEERYDDLASLAATIRETPIASGSLVDSGRDRSRPRGPSGGAPRGCGDLARLSRRATASARV